MLEKKVKWSTVYVYKQKKVGIKSYSKYARPYRLISFSAFDNNFRKPCHNRGVYDAESKGGMGQERV